MSISFHPTDPTTRSLQPQRLFLTVFLNSLSFSFRWKIPAATSLSSAETRIRSNNSQSFWNVIPIIFIFSSLHEDAGPKLAPDTATISAFCYLGLGLGSEFPMAEAVEVQDIGELVTPAARVGDRKLWKQVRKDRGELLALYLHGLARRPADTSLKFMKQFLAGLGLDQITDGGHEAGEVLFCVGPPRSAMTRIMDEKLAEVRGRVPYVVYGINLWAGACIYFFKWRVDKRGRVLKLVCSKFYRIMFDDDIVPIIRGILSSVKPLRGREGVSWEYRRDDTLGTDEADDLEDEEMYETIKNMVSAGASSQDILRATRKPATR